MSQYSLATCDVQKKTRRKHADSLLPCATVFSDPTSRATEDLQDVRGHPRLRASDPGSLIFESGTVASLMTKPSSVPNGLHFHEMAGTPPSSRLGQSGQPLLCNWNAEHGSLWLADEESSSPSQSPAPSRAQSKSEAEDLSAVSYGPSVGAYLRELRFSRRRSVAH